MQELAKFGKNRLPVQKIQQNTSYSILQLNHDFAVARNKEIKK